MSNFTFDEINLMCIYNTGTRAGLMQALTDMRKHLEPESLHFPLGSLQHR